MSKDKEEICANCHWLVLAGAGTHGYCKRFPPVFTKNDEKGFPRFFNPIVGLNSFCGEWEEADD